ncbi:Glutamine--fructose-6-phosphate aminotransferase [isomerizing] [Rubripirellula lacrimiformis]|uniref:Glutamine--fructose-6-phosphate aminotransferase [isomerizing] n=1 Tax=Rubripirellula lacrimiformis TaxID=1930273 RepID=A0A517N449_9BACT|nr:glutamine--fructose-6-phosphate transaminase (isomerizing) [Rubripirellula lacrimiformis]QDT01920.1 Glutamine--fructose-6-phosphate aminotransferase [isomerizing] [Rubripirellula lacrimiformis]
MCGIVGYVGADEACPFLIDGLRRLEYRGYDSSGVAIHSGASFDITRSVGRIDSLVGRMGDSPAKGTMGIGHTRWATHGPATEPNAHPHQGGDGEVVLVHNGVIENFQILKDELIEKGYQFKSETDSEVAAHLIAENLKNTPEIEGQPNLRFLTAVQTSVARLRGTYGLAVAFRDRPNFMIAARFGSPLVIGVGKGEYFVSSDASPLAGRTDRIVYMADHQIAVLTPDGFSVLHRDSGKVRVDIRPLEVDTGDVSLGGYDHYMLKEIFEQPESIRNAMRGRLDDQDATAVFGGLNLTPQQLRSVERIILTGCGTSWHSALVGEYLIEGLARIPVSVEYASELRYRNPPIENNTLVFGITQSGETADTLAALRETKRKGHRTLAICNVVASSIAQAADGGVYLHAGPEIGVASTKAYTSQCCVLAMLALYFGRTRHLSFEGGQRLIEELRRLPTAVQQALTCDEQVRDVAKKYCDATNVLYLGRQYNFPTALEGALKLKEISYIHAEGYPAAEMKHGPIALVDEKTPSVFIVPRGTTHDKVMANMEEVKARGGPIIAVASHDDPHIEAIADDVIRVPQVQEFLQPIVTVVPLQLLSYHIALLRGCDVDKPRNLAKSVTVE